MSDALGREKSEQEQKSVMPDNEIPDQDNPDQQLPDQSALAAAVSEDPLARFFNENQKFFTYVLLGVVAAILLYRWYDSSHRTGQMNSAEMLYNIQESYQQLNSNEAEDQNAAMRKLEGAVTTLKDQKYPYNLLARNYQALEMVRKNENHLVRAELENINWKNPATGQESEVLWNELLALYLAKALIEDSEHSGYAYQAIKDLAKESEYVRVSALIAWRGIAQSYAEEKEINEVNSLIEQTKQDFPEQSALFD